MRLANNLSTVSRRKLVRSEIKWIYKARMRGGTPLRGVPLYPWLIAFTMPSKPVVLRRKVKL
jgi:hypothetical protein